MRAIIEFFHSYQPDAGSCALVRRDVLGFLTAAGLDQDTVEAAVLVVNELASNAADHAGTPFDLVLILTAGRLRVEVSDGSTDRPQLRPLDPGALRGRGLQMVDHLATSWTWRTDRDGKSVTAEFDLSLGCTWSRIT